MAGCNSVIKLRGTYFLNSCVNHFSQNHNHPKKPHKHT